VALSEIDKEISQSAAWQAFPEKSPAKAGLLHG
jgi:hypothetical protein